MEKSDQRVGIVFPIFIGICIIALPFIVLSALSYEPADKKTGVLEPQSLDFDHKGGAIFVSYDRVTQDYLAGISTERTLSEYYSRRQYVGSPPYIPHKVEEADLAPIECLTCHARGGVDGGTEAAYAYNAPPGAGRLQAMPHHCERGRSLQGQQLGECCAPPFGTVRSSRVADRYAP